MTRALLLLPLLFLSLPPTYSSPTDCSPETSIFNKFAHIEAVFWGVEVARAVLEGRIPPSSYSQEMEIVGAMESLLYGLRNLEVVGGGDGGEGEDIEQLIEKIHNFMLCHIQHRTDLYHLRGIAEALIEEASDIVDLSDSLSSPPPFPSSFYSSSVPNAFSFYSSLSSPSRSFSPLGEEEKKKGGGRVKLRGGSGEGEREMPLLGFGTWRVPGGEDCKAAVKAALDAGYKRIDTAYVYGTEGCIGEILKDRSDKNDIFITTKIPDNEFGDYNRISHIVKQQLKLMNREKIDMYMLHGPGQDRALRRTTWKALEALVAEGVIDYLGVSNANIDVLKDIASYAKIQPSMVQNKYDLYHPGDQMVTGGQYHPQWHDIVGYCRDNGIVFESYSSLSAWPFALKAANDPIVKYIGKLHNKNAAQVVIRAHLQQHIAVIPRSGNPAHIRDNFDVFDFELGEEEMAWLGGLRYLASSPIFAGANTGDNIFSVDPTDIPTSVDPSFCKHPTFRSVSFISQCQNGQPELFWVNNDDGSRHSMGTVGTEEPKMMDTYVGHRFATSSGEDFHVSENRDNNNFVISCPYGRV